FHHDIAEYAAADIRVFLGPGPGLFQRVELRHDETAGESRGTRVVAVGSGERTSQGDAVGGNQILQTGNVGRAVGSAKWQAVGSVFTDDGVEHGFPREHNV